MVFIACPHSCCNNQISNADISENEVNNRHCSLFHFLMLCTMLIHPFAPVWAETHASLSHTCTAVTLSRHTSPLSRLNLFGSRLVTHICHSSVSSSYNILVLAYLRRDNLCFPSCSPAVPKRVAHFRLHPARAEAPTFSLLPWLVFFVDLGSERGGPSLAICPCSSPLVWC